MRFVTLLALGHVLVLASCGGDGTSVDGGPSEALPPSTASSATSTEATELAAVTEPLEVSPESTATGSEPAATTEPETTSTSDSTLISASTATTDEVVTSSSAMVTSPPTTDGTLLSDWGSPETVRLRFESMVADVSVEDFTASAMAILSDDRGWGKAGFSFVADPDAEFRVVLAEGPDVDQLCLPLRTYSKVSCQNGPVVALNADRWRTAVGHWELDTSVYRGYLVNHEVGHLLGQRHPKPRCPVAGQLAGVMEQQTAGLEGCVGNPWPRDWEIFYAGVRPVVYAPLPDWGPDPVPENREGQ